MGQPSSKDEMTIRHQFDRLCQMALKGEAVNSYKHMDYRRKHEVTFSELSEKELSKLFTMDEYGCIFRKNRALAPHERSAVPLGTDHCPVG